MPGVLWQRINLHLLCPLSGKVKSLLGGLSIETMGPIKGSEFSAKQHLESDTGGLFFYFFVSY